ncbi:MAG TPA: malonic semialdehyde reductase [Burkholderiales bacterium]|nr:malonic semialdehyde reductase [Burkholderiales bacterium]
MTDHKTLDLMLRNARSYAEFEDRPVPEALLRAAHELMKWGPTTANSQPARIFYLVSQEEKNKLGPALSNVNREKTLKAPVVAIVAYDTRFWENLPRLYHNPDAINWYKAPDKAEVNGFRNGSLQGAYLILALRAVGLDCGPMSGFDNAKVDAAFFPDGRLKSNFLINIGYGIADKLPPRGYRFTFEEQCRIL